MYMCFSKTPALSPTGDARPFAAGGDGTALGEGLGVLTLKRLDDARRDGDRIYAVIRGIGSSSDGKGNAVYAPSLAGQAKCLRRAYEEAGISPRDRRAGRGPRHRHQGRRRGRAGRPGRGLSVGRRRGDLVRPRVGQVADRPHQGRGRRGRADQGGAGPAPQGPAADDQGRPARPTWRCPGPPRSTSTPRPGPGSPGPTTPAAPPSAPSASAGPTSTASSKKPTPSPRRSPGTATTRSSRFSGPTAGGDPGPARRLARRPGWDAFRAEAARSRASFRAADPDRLAIAAGRSGTPWAKLVDRARALLDGGPGRLARGGLLRDRDRPRRPGRALPRPGVAVRVGMLRDLACRFPELIEAARPRLRGREIDLVDRIYPQPAFDDPSRRGRAMPSGPPTSPSRPRARSASGRTGSSSGSASGPTLSPATASAS